MRLTEDQRRRLAAKGKPLGHKLLSKVCTIVTPDTIMAWYRRLIAPKWTYPRAKVGRPGVMKEIRRLIVRMAEENPNWGYCRIQGAMKNLDHRVARSTVSKVLKEHGIAPAPGRPSSWRTFIKSHAAVIAAAGFFTTEVWTARGLVTHYTLFSELFKAILRGGGTKLVHMSIQAPDMNAFAIHYHADRPHQGLQNALICGGPTAGGGRVEVRERLGGLLKPYYRKAA